METAIKTVDLVREFKTSRGVFRALDGVNLEIPSGMIYGLLGPNGAGKTTLIRILSTLLLPTSGDAYVGGYHVVREAQKVREIINLVSGGERPGYGILTTRENLIYYAMLYGYSRRKAEERVEEVSRLIGLEDFMNKRLNELSTGMVQKYSLARGLLNNPRILFLDEPTLGLDVENARSIRKLIRRLVDDGYIETILLTSHYMYEVEELCDRIAIIHRGRIIEEGTVEELKERVSSHVIYELTLQRVDGDLDFLRELDSVIGYKVRLSDVPGEARLRIIMAYEDISRVIGLLEKKMYRVKRVVRDEISLEDVFLKLVGRGIDE